MPLFTFRFFCLLTINVCLAAVCFADGTQAPLEYTAREWHDSDGLPSEEIDSLALDDRGYLWVAGPSRFARFDGTAFEVSKTPPEVFLKSMSAIHDPAQIKAACLVAPANATSAPDSGDRVDAAGWFLYIDGEFRFQPEPEITGKIVKTTFCEKSGVLWLGCEDGTLLRRNDRDTRLFAPPPGPAGKKAPTFATDKESRVWALSNDRVTRFDGPEPTPVSVENISTTARIVSSRTGGPWLVTQNAVSKWTDGKLQEIAQVEESIGAHYIQAAIEDRHGNLWIGTRSQGLYRIVGQQAVRMPVSHADISALQEDPDGNIWVGTNGGGLVRLKTKTFWLYDRSSGLTDDFSHSVAADRDGTIWLANRDGGVARIQNGVVDPISKRAGWRSFSAKSIFPAADGGMWVTTGIGVFRTRGGDPDRVDRVRELANVRAVRVTFVARNGDCWLAADDPDRILRWRDGEVTSFGAAEGFDGREVRAITEDDAGFIWVGAADGRLFRSRGENFERVPLPDGQDYGVLQALWFEPDGTLLVGTTRKGILILPQGSIAPSLLTTKLGLPNGDVTNILKDGTDRYWFASRGGLFSIQGAQLRDFAAGKIKRVHTVLIGKDHGLPQLSALGRTQPSAWKAPDGVLWFTTRKGVVRVEPALTSEASDPVPATIARILCDGKRRTLADTLKLQTKVRKTEIRFSVLSLSVPEQTFIRHRLDGFDNDWVQPGNNRAAIYPSLPPGNYTLHVEVSNGDETWLEQPPLLTIIVVAPWWQRPWAQLAYLLALVLCVAVTVRYWAYRRFRNRLEHLERQRALERERTRIARNIHDELGASLTRISLITQSVQHKNPSHAAEFEQIFETVRDSTGSLDEIVWAVNPKLDDVENLVGYLGNFTQKFLGSAGIRRVLNLPEYLPPTKVASQARHSLFLCCKEALNNVVKHAGATEVALTIGVNDSMLRIEIADDGRGLETGRNASANTERIASGNGLRNMRERMEEMGGIFEISKHPGGGTIVILAVKLPVTIKLDGQELSETAPPFPQ